MLRALQVFTARRGNLSRRSLSLTLAVAGTALAGLLVILSLGAGADDAELRTWALVVLAITLFATHVLPEHVTALTIMLLAVLGEVAPTAVIFSGFEVGALWLLFSGIIIGNSVQEAGLGVLLARRLLGLWRLSLARAIVLLVVIAALLGFLVPATIPRIILLMPIALGIAEAMELRPGSKGYTGLAIAVGAGTFFPDFAIVTANLPAVVHVGAIESIYGVAISYGQYLFYHLPVTGIFRALVLVAAILLLFRQPAREVADIKAEPMNPRQRRLAAVLVLALILWMTDVFHGVHPAWVAMGAAVVILWPAMQLISPTAFKDKINFAPVLYIAGILSIGAIMIHNGLDETVSAFALTFVDLGVTSDFLNLYLVTALSSAICMVTTAPAAPILLVPIAGDISAVTGLPLSGVLMAELVGFTTMLLPYQGPPLIVMLSLCEVRVLDLVKVCLILAAAMFLVGVPLTYLWWKAIGLL